jgi:PBSX family phage terminase large subunit
VPVATAERPLPEQKPYQPYGTIKAMFYDFSPELIVSGPADTGKSRGILERMYLLACRYPKARMLMTRKHRASLTESAMVTFERFVVPDDSPVLHGPQREQRHAYRFPNGSEIVTGGLGDDKEKTRIMSTEYDLIYVQEAREISESEWEELSTRCSGRAGAMPFHQLIGDTNPDAASHWIKQRHSRGQLKLLEARHSDNPSVTPERLAVLDALSGVRYKRLRLGLWVAAEGIVYDGYDAAVHLGNWQIGADWERWLSIDFGFTNPFVCQWWAQDPDGRLYRYREIYQTQTLVEDHAHRIREFSVGEEIHGLVCDHDAEDRATLERHLRCSCVPWPALELGTTAAKKDVSPGIQLVAARLRLAGDGQPRIRYCQAARVERDAALAERKLPTCTEEEFESYVWDKAQAKLNPDGTALADVPLKLNDHGMDATRYMVAHFDLRKPGWDVVNQSASISHGGEAEATRSPMSVYRTRTAAEVSEMRRRALEAMLSGEDE